MRYLTLVYSVIFIAMTASCQVIQEKDEKSMTVATLCNLNARPSGNLDKCSGDFYLHFQEEQADFKYSEDLGYYLVFKVTGTYDCSVLGVVCDGDNLEEYLDKSVLVSGDLHSYNRDFAPPVGGLKIYSLENLIFN